MLSNVKAVNAKPLALKPKNWEKERPQEKVEAGQKKGQNRFLELPRAEAWQLKIITKSEGKHHEQITLIIKLSSTQSKS